MAQLDAIAAWLDRQQPDLPPHSRADAIRYAVGKAFAGLPEQGKPKGRRSKTK